MVYAVHVAAPHGLEGYPDTKGRGVVDDRVYVLEVGGVEAPYIQRPGTSAERKGAGAVGLREAAVLGDDDGKDDVEALRSPRIEVEFCLALVEAVEQLPGGVGLPEEELVLASAGG